jgi:hypothetical protein
MKVKGMILKAPLVDIVSKGGYAATRLTRHVHDFWYFSMSVRDGFW